MRSILIFPVEIDVDRAEFENTVEIRYNGLEGTGEFWLLNPNVVKSNYHFFVFFHKKQAKSNWQTYLLNEL